MAIINNLIYFDNNEATAVDDSVAEAMLRYESDPYAALPVQKAEAAVQLSRMLGCRPPEVFFTTGTGPAMDTGMQVVFEAVKHKGSHIITSAAEHSHMLQACRQLVQKGAEVTYLGVDREGLIDTDALAAAITPATSMVSIMAANDQTGVIQPIEKIAEVCRANDIVFFSDASQYIGKMRFDAADPGPDCMAFDADKMYGPKGIGALFARENTAAYRAMLAHEEKHPAAINSALLAGFSKAAEVFTNGYWDTSSHISKIKGYLEHQLLEVEGLRINGSTRYRLYNTSNLTFPAHKKISLLADRFKFTGFEQGSHVLKAMGVDNEDIRNSYRFSFGKYNTLDEVKMLVEAIMAL